MKILILAAGLGTRLMPLTKNKPKALVEFKGKPILEHLILKLKHDGFNDLIINVHHFADQILDFLNSNKNFGVNIEISDERKQLLDTGGAILKAKKYLQNSDVFIIYNADISTDIELHELISAHQHNKAIATLAVQKRESSRKLLFDDMNYLCQWKNINTTEYKISRVPSGNLTEWSFSGIHILQKEILNKIIETGKFSVIDLYLRLAENYKISAFETNHSYWFDLGQVQNIKEAEKFIISKT